MVGGHRTLGVAARHRGPQHDVQRRNVADPHATTNMHVDVPCTRDEGGRGGRKEENDDPMPTSEREEDEEEQGGVDVPMEGPPDGDEDGDDEEEEPTEDPNVAKGGFTWRIPGFTVLKERKMYSETFQVGGYQWCERKRNEEKRRRNETIRYDTMERTNDPSSRTREIAETHPRDSNGCLRMNDAFAFEAPRIQADIGNARDARSSAHGNDWNENGQARAPVPTRQQLRVPLPVSGRGQCG